MLSALFRKVRRFHNEEDGLETMQVVMIIAIAAMILIAAKMFGKQVIKWAGEQLDNLMGD